MAIPESQLDTWASQGTIAGSRDTYNAIKTILQSRDATYADKDFSIFLQGSYGNDTNIYAESDVDIVIQLDSCFLHDIDKLPMEQKSAFHQAYTGSVSYGLTELKRDVQAHLKQKYGTAVVPGDKAIKITAGNGRRNADVIVSMGFRYYRKFAGMYDQKYDDGMCFFNSSGTRIANYPKKHSENLTTKHQSTSNWYKPTVRIFKNLRSRLIQEGMIAAGDAPSYYLEGLLYNVPDTKFGSSYEDCVVNSLNWLSGTDRSQLVCANEQYYLLREGFAVTWRDAKCTAFLNAACDLWRQW
jgi:hypothetical protein